ncbi:hypothetical protein [Pigmentiphaga soli]
MQAESFFEWLGNICGAVIRTLVATLRAVLGGLGEAIAGFSAGLAHAIGMTPSAFNYILLAIGLLLLYGAIRALMRGAVLGGIILLVITVLLLGGLIG